MMGIMDSMATLTPDPQPPAHPRRPVLVLLGAVLGGVVLLAVTAFTGFGASPTSARSAAPVHHATQRPAGTCFGVSGGALGVGVSCSAEHAYEQVGTVDLKTRFPGGRPTQAQQQQAIAAQCPGLAASYTAHADLTKLHLVVTGSPVTAKQWAAGDYLAPCLVGTAPLGKRHPTLVTNSVRGIGAGG